MEQEPGSKKKHLNTREFKQQKNALESLQQETQTVSAVLKEGRQRESVLRERVQSYERQAQEAEEFLKTQSTIPDASMFNFKPALEQARRIIEQQKMALAGKPILERQNERLKEEVHGLTERNGRLEAENTLHKKQSGEAIGRLLTENSKQRAEMEEVQKFLRQPEINRLHIDYLQREREWAARKAKEQKEREREQQQREERERQAKEQEKQKAQELERQREEQQRLAREKERSRRGMGMSR